MLPDVIGNLLCFLLKFFLVALGGGIHFGNRDAMQLHLFELRDVVVVKLFDCIGRGRLVLLFQALKVNLAERGHTLDPDSLLELRFLFNSRLAGRIGKYEQVDILLC